MLDTARRNMFFTKVKDCVFVTVSVFFTLDISKSLSSSVKENISKGHRDRGHRPKSRRGSYETRKEEII